jgi:metallo-beta-lactamase family protein
MQDKPQRTFLVHGEEESAFAFKGVLETQAGLSNIEVPELGQTFDV